MRYAWTDLNLDGTHNRRNFILDVSMRAFRKWDKRAASRVHQFAAISQAVSRRIADAYQRDASIIHPPVDVARFKPCPQREDYFITVTRLVPHKRVDLIVRAFSQLNLPLVVVGDGSELPRLRGMSNSNVKFLGYIPDEQVAELLGRARGFVCAAEEDFGIAIVEAQAAGCPVIAYRAGGALETVREGITGLFFEEQDAGSLIEAIQRFEKAPDLPCPDEMVENAQRFGRERFIGEFQKFAGITINR
jgi:glycosyltransferase involved in cell wall biosynthesis